MGVLRGSFVLLLTAALLPAAACAQDAGSASAADQEGRYEDAIRIGMSVVESNPDDLVARRALVSALIEVGRYDEAIDRAGPLDNLRGDALRARGRLQEAEEAYARAIGAGGEDRWTAEFNLAEMMYQRGAREEAEARFDAFITLYNRSDALPTPDLVAVGNAVWYLGNLEPDLFHDAVMAFDEATKQEPRAIEAHIRIAELFLEKYNSTEAHSALADAAAINPRHPRALLAQARAQVFDGDRGAALDLVNQALEVNPNLVPARLFLARMLLDTEEAEAAMVEIQKAREVNPRSLEALSMAAAIHYLSDQTSEYEQLVAQVRQLNPRYPGLYITTAEIAGQTRRYGDAARLAQQAIEVDPTSWPAHSLLGLNAFRLGQVDAAREAMETAFAGDPYNVLIKNNLDLLDTFAQYEVREAPGLQFMLHQNEADLLQPYLMEAAVQAHTDLTTRFGDRPRGPVRIELYPRSADFSVRTVGLAGMGALGVSFGDVVALDSPGARQAGQYNWLTTLWHELAHTVALGVSNNRVPRWFTEGLSVVQEGRSTPSWTSPVMPEFLQMYYSGVLPPPSKLNEGFIRPQSPQHLSGAYELSSLVIEWIEENHGFDAIVQILRAYGQGRSDEQVIRSVLRMSPEELDEAFEKWMEARYPADRPVEFQRLMTEARRAADGNDTTRAKRLLEQAGALFQVSQGGSPFTALAEIRRAEGDVTGAIEALKVVSAADDMAYQPNLLLAELLEDQGDLAGAADALERAVWIHPYDPAPHLKLAELYSGLGQHAKVVRERRAVVGLRPTDMADAYFRLAEALFDAGDMTGARQEVLRALDVAPAFQEAQDLLLRIHDRS